MGNHPSALAELLYMSNEVFSAVSNLGAVGVIFWLVAYVTKNTIPKMAKKFEDSLKDAREDFKDLAEQQRVFFKQITDDQRSDFKNMSEEQRIFFSKQICQEHEKLENIADLLKRGLVQKDSFNGH